MAQQPPPQVLQSIDAVQTAAELRRQLHTMKADDQRAVRSANVSGTEQFLRSHWATALFTGLGSFGLLYLTNPSFVQSSAPEDKKYQNAPPSMRHVAAWSILAALVVAFGPLIFKRISTVAAAKTGGTK